jgi:hypothetical protein
MNIKDLISGKIEGGLAQGLEKASQLGNLGAMLAISKFGVSEEDYQFAETLLWGSKEKVEDLQLPLRYMVRPPKEDAANLKFFEIFRETLCPKIEDILELKEKLTSDTPNQMELSALGLQAHEDELYITVSGIQLLKNAEGCLEDDRLKHCSQIHLNYCGEKEPVLKDSLRTLVTSGNADQTLYTEATIQAVCHSLLFYLYGVLDRSGIIRKLQDGTLLKDLEGIPGFNGFNR